MLSLSAKQCKFDYIKFDLISFNPFRYYELSQKRSVTVERSTSITPEISVEDRYTKYVLIVLKCESVQRKLMLVN